VDNINLRPGPHTIEVKSKGYSSWTQTVNLSDGSRETYTANLNQKSRFAAGFLGAIFPGGGHFYSGRGGMGTFMLLATAGTGAWAFSQTTAMTDAEDIYRDIQEQYINASTTTEAEQLHIDMQEAHDEWSDAQGSASTAVMAAIGVHVFGVLHSAIFMPRLRPVITSGGPTLVLKAGTRAGRASLTLSINF
jgi:TM2 domain-containing membrane protein YozV